MEAGVVAGAEVAGEAAAGGIALMVSVGNLGGFLGPFLIGWIRDLTQTFSVALVLIAACLTIGMVLMLLVGDPARTSSASL